MALRIANDGSEADIPEIRKMMIMSMRRFT